MEAAFMESQIIESARAWIKGASVERGLRLLGKGPIEGLCDLGPNTHMLTKKD